MSVLQLRLILLMLQALWCCVKKTDSPPAIQPANSLSVAPADTVTEPWPAYDDLFKLENYLATGKIDGAKQDTVDFDCAILVYPTSDQIDEMKETGGEEDFYIGADDSNWYQGMAIGMIDSVGIRTITASGKYLRLEGQATTWHLDMRKKNLPAWNLVFFKRTKEPRIVSTVDLTVDQVRDYFDVVD